MDTGLTGVGNAVAGAGTGVDAGVSGATQGGVQVGSGLDAHGASAVDAGLHGAGANPWAGVDVSQAFGGGVHGAGADASLFGDGAAHTDLGTHVGGDIVGDMLHS
ncbi:hypothetical protein D7D52_31455 [Nocardia yunnanensis]|uniref:Uncharacterized protein n=1 Tax=Nocardia yunnanensis TaxID=2382165 RepID=A0A386ZI46_9NOCA|nr:hypothetical protein D7D52_31455 [Nocardia yunnanensis]